MKITEQCTLMTHASSLLAVSAGGLLTLMILLNSQLGQYSSPLTASWIAHGVGAGFAGVVLLCKYSQRRASVPNNTVNTPIWAYLGGAPGAFTVVLAAITVNSPLGIAGSLSLMLMGQTLFGLICDTRGWMGTPQRCLSLKDIMPVLCILGGSLLIIFSPE